MIRSLTLLIFIFLTACVSMPARTLKKGEEPQANQIILIGRLTIDKKLPKSTNFIDVTGILDSGLIRAGKTDKPLVQSLSGWDFTSTDIQAKYGELFIVPYERIAHIAVSGIYSFSYNNKGQETYVFPVRGFIRAEPGARYFYVGHISLKLDEFYGLKSAHVIDEFEQDSKSLSRFKGIRKSLMVIE
jgi:hypothetical protein